MAYALSAADIERGSQFTKRGRVDYAAFGKGKKPLVLIPGMSLKPVTPLAKEAAIRYRIFSERFRIYIIDRCEYMPDGYTIRDMADDAAEALHGLGIHGACVFGASQGGMITLSLALRYPELVDKLAVGSTWARPNATGMETFREWSRLGRAGDANRMCTEVVRHIYSETGSDLVKAISDEMRLHATTEDIRRFAVSADANVSFNVYDQLNDLKCPLLALGAEKDAVLGAAATKEIAEKLGCESYIYPKAGHAVYDEAPDYPERLLHFFEDNQKQPLRR